MKQSLRIQFMSFAAILVAAGSTYSQRYATEIYSDAEIEVISNVSYGTNIRFLPYVDFTTPAAQADVSFLQGIASTTGVYPDAYYDPSDASTTVNIQNMLMDIYQPMHSADDTEARPLIIYLHTGNFLPPPQNGAPTGIKTDSLAIVACTQWAKRGFVAASISYRLGWNPTGDAQERRSTLLNAVFRAIQDAKQAVRFLKDDAENANNYKIDPNKIVLFGEGSGGYVALAYATVHDLEAALGLPKFTNPVTNESYVDPGVVGDENGFDGTLSLYRPNGQNGDISMIANLGGALGDSSWVNPGNVPMIAFHTVRDDFAPFDNGTVIVPTTMGEVVDVSGANVFIQRAAELGNNDAFALLNGNDDPFTQQAESLYGTGPYAISNDLEVTISTTPYGLYPFVFPLRPFLANIASPWQWWDPNSPLAQAVVGEVGGNPVTAHMASLASNPDMSPEQGRAYLDTIQGYAIPRIMCVLDLPGSPCAVGIDEVKVENATSIYPNPAKSSLTIRNDESIIRRIELVDITGRVVAVKNVNAHTYILERGSLHDGIYLMQIHFDSEQITKKVLFN